MQTPKQYIKTQSEKIESSKGIKGITALKNSHEKCVKEWERYRQMFVVTSKYRVPDGWSHRHGLSQSVYMLRRANAAKIILSTKPAYGRGEYNEILFPCLPEKTLCYNEEKLYQKWAVGYRAAKKCIKDIESRGFDEHGGWIESANFDSKGRGMAINVDIYGIDEANNLFAVQVRRYDKINKNGWGNVRKNYFLIGYNENGNPFAHPIPSGIIHAAIRKNPSTISPVNAARAWIWDIKPEQLSDVLRNGDVALIPAKTAEIKKAVVREEKRVRVINSHYLFGKEIRVNGHLFALNPTLRHYKRQHPTQHGIGWYRVAVAKRAKFWDFARPTAD